MITQLVNNIVLVTVQLQHSSGHGAVLLNYSNRERGLYHSLCFCRTLLKQDTVITVRGVPLTSYMESLIEGTMSKNVTKVGVKS